MLSATAPPPRPGPPGDDQRRRQADHVVVRLLAEQAQFLQPLAVGRARAPSARCRSASPRPRTLLDVRMPDLAQFVEQPGAQFRRAVRQALLLDHPQRRPRHRAGQRIAAVGAAVAAGAEHAQDFARSKPPPIRDTRRPRAPCPECSTSGCTSSCWQASKRAGPAQPGLDLVGDHEHPLARADLRGFAQISVGRNQDAGLALNRLEQEGAGVRRDGAAPAPPRRRKAR